MTSSTPRRILILFALILVPGLLSACGRDDEPQHMVVAANRHAAKAALDILARGGSAVDAAVATQLILTLVEPQSSGIGGGGYMLHWDRESQVISAYDGRETAPKAATPDLFMSADGEPMRFFEALVGGRAVGVPGIVAMLWKAHKAHGRLKWAELFQPAIKLAVQGFRVSPMLHKRIGQRARYLTHPSVRDYFFVPGTRGANAPSPLPVGHILKNQAYAETLGLIAKFGADGFYQGKVAKAIVRAVRSHRNRGELSLDDLAHYRAKLKSAICLPYRKYKVCGMPPSTSGGVAVLQILKMLEPFSMHRFRPNSAMAVHLISEASKLAYADRALYLADPDYVAVPVAGLIDAGYLLGRARSIHPGKAASKVEPGTPPGIKTRRFARGTSLTRPSTSHFTIVDSRGNVVSMTSSVEYAFGAHIMAAGFVLNNQLTDFSFRPARGGKPVANAPAGGKRPRSSMSPTLVFDDKGRFFAALGSPGGSRIIGFVAQTLVALIDWGMDMQSAVALPKHVARTGPVDLEAGTPLAGLEAKLRAFGHEVKIRALTSGLHGIALRNGRLDGGADPRREGVVLPARP